MTLRVKTLAVLAVTFASLVLVVYVVSRLVLLDGFASFEDENVTTNTRRVLAALSEDVSELDAELANWVEIIDIGNVGAEPDKDFSRLLTEAFTNLQIDFTMVVDSSGKIVFRKAVDVQSGRDTPFPSSFEDHFATHDLLIGHTSPDSNITGYVSLPEGPMIVVSRPVPDSANDKPVGGSMLFVRHLDDVQIDALGRSTQLTLEVREVAKSGMPDDFQAVLPQLTDKESIATRRLDDDEVAGYALLDDVYGNPSILVRAQMPSAIRKQGQTTLTYLLITVVAIGSLFALVTIVGLERVVLSPLARLSRSVEDIAGNAGHSARISVAGGDELGRLADGINTMLAQLEASHTETVDTERQRGEKATAVVRAEELERSRTRVLAVSESVRKDIARHLHGSVQNKLILLLHRIDSLGQASPSDLSAEVRSIHEDLQDLIENDVRKASVQIYPDILRRGLVPALESLADRFEGQLDLETDLDRELAISEKSDRNTVPENLRLSVYRVAEEALTNALKHSDAKKVTMALERKAEGSLRLKVSDDGRGFDVDAEAQGVGLGTMRDYAEAAGGRLTIESVLGDGTLVIATVPLDPA